MSFQKRSRYDLIPKIYCDLFFTDYQMCSPMSCCFKKSDTFVVNHVHEKNGVVKQNGQGKAIPDRGITVSDEVCEFDIF